MKPKILLLHAALITVPLAAQLAPPNSIGAAFGHVHLNVRDVDAQERFLSQVGGTPIQRDKLLLMQFPGIYVILRKQDPTAPAVGSIVNHFGLHVKDLSAWLPKWEAAGLKIQKGASGKQLNLFGPDDIKVEIIEDPSIPTTVAMHHIHMYAPDPDAVQAWYVKYFGASGGKRNANYSAVVPGGEISIGKGDMPLPGTKGRLIDHIGFEVKNLDEFAKKLQDAGLKLEDPGIRNSANASNLRIAFVTDPWGTNIELTEGLAPLQQKSSR